VAYTFKHGDRPLDEFTIQRAVGRGGFGEVYYAVSDGGREVALKYLKENPHVELRGVSNCINLKSPYLVSIFDVKKSNEGEYFIVMEYCSGPSLRDLLIAEPKGFSPEKAVFFAREIAKGLAYLHERGIVHRDLKPGNIFFDDGYVKIGDYGLSKFISVSRHSAQTASVGTVHYMAPEIGSGSYSRGVDIYALGVMLYEMLCGKVPFEGSTMAEVLMKHLTTRPELDELPHGFSRIIRKALEKDPKDRYQTVEEMVDDLLSGEEIQKSLAGFKPDSLSAAVRHHGGDRADSPMPSPNSPRGGFAYAAEVMREARREHQLPPLPDKVAKKFDKISRKLDKKMAKLAGRFPSAPPHADALDGSPLAHVPVGKRIVLVGFLLAALSVAFGLLIGNSSHEHAEERGGAAGMLAAAMFISVSLGRRAVPWFGVQSGPRWAERLVRGVCAAGPLAIGCAPIFDVGGGMPVWLALIASAALFKWDDLVDDSLGEIKVGQIFSKALGALVLTAIIDSLGGFPGPPNKVMFISAGAAAIAAFVLQANAAWVTRTREPARTDGGGDDPHGGGTPARDMAATVDLRRTPPPPPPPIPMDSRTGHISDSMNLAHGAARWGLARAFWALVAFGLMGGTIVTFLIPLISTPRNPHDITLAVVMCCGLAAFTFFALRKTGPMKRPGFWRETLRPFLISTSLFGIGGTTTGIAREWDCTYGSPEDCESEIDQWEQDLADQEVHIGGLPAIQAQIRNAREQIALHAGSVHVLARAADGWRGDDRCVSDEGRVALVSGLVMSSLSLLFLTFFTGGTPRAPRPFLQGSVGGSAGGPIGSRAEVINHRAPMILVFGLVGLFTGVFPLGIAAWVMGHHDLQEMRAGRMDPSGIGMTRAGVVCGAMISLIALAACLFGMVAILVALVK
jgi:serine/threonine protein kinase